MSTSRKYRSENKKSRSPKLFNLTIKNLKSMFRDKGQLAWIFGYPLLFIVVFAMFWGGSGSRSVYSLVVVNNDIVGVSDPEDSMEGAASIILMDVLKSDNLSNYIEIKNGTHFSELNNTQSNAVLYDEAYQLLRYEKIDAIIVIDEEFSESIFSSEGTPLINITTINDEVTEGVVSSIISQIVNQIQMNISNIKPAKISVSKAEDTVELSGFDLMAPGFIIAGVMVCISQIAAHFAEEKEKGTLERLMTTPVARWKIIISAFTSQLVICVIQVFLMLIIATQIFGAFVHPNANWIVIFLIPMLFSLSSLGLGTIVAAIVDTESSAEGLAWLFILPMQFLGGIFVYGADIGIGRYIPTTYAVHAIRLAMTNGIYNWDAIGFDIIFMVSFGLITTVIGILLFLKRTSIE